MRRGVARTRRDDPSARWSAVHEEVAREVEELVTRGLVGVDGPPCAEDLVAREDDDGLGRHVRREPARGQSVDLVREAEGPGNGDAVAEIAGVAVPARPLRDAWIVEVDRDLE